MTQWEHFSSLTARQRAEMMAIATEFEISHGRDALDENRRRSVQHGANGNYWIARSERGEIVSFAVAETNLLGTSIEIVGGAYDASLDESLRRSGIADALWWLRDNQIPHVDHEVVRFLRYMEADEIHHEPPVTDLTLRTFAQGRDDDAWIEANNRAFADHPEQGACDRQSLQARLQEHWFDPSGFLLLLDEGQIAASCWTKIHELPEVRTGEIYVIFVHPDFQGRGLGELVLRYGLESIHHRGVHRASLFVEDSNFPAITMYEKLGFETRRLDRLVSISR
jgi:ribosomal protein S18 acetylase RimI-like enzyme